MISLKQYILESSIRKKYNVLLSQIDLKKIPSLDKLTTMLKDALEQAVLRWQILRIKAVEEYNKSVDNRNETRLKKELAEKEAEVIQHIQSHPGLLRRSKEKQQEYIDKKLEVVKSKFRPEEYAAADFDTSTIVCDWHNDPTRENEHQLYNGDWSSRPDKIDKIAPEIAKDIYEKIELGQGGKLFDEWNHLIGIDIVCTERDLPHWRAYCQVIPMFDEETEKEFPKSVQRFYDYMSDMYRFGHFSGD